jgi:predicted transcriptional regulator of viral defense system
MGRSRALDAGLDKLQEFLLAMTPGDEVSVVHARDISGLDGETCDAVLSALMRAGLMMRLQHDAYVRVRLAETERQAGLAPVSAV